MSPTDVEEILGGTNVVCYQENELFLKSVALLYLLVSQGYHSKLAHTWWLIATDIYSVIVQPEVQN